MVRAFACFLVVAAALANGFGAPAGGASARCNELPSFGTKDSLNTADFKLGVRELRVRVSDTGPDLHLQLEPDAAWKSTADVAQREGWIRVLSCDSGSLLQSLEVQGKASPEMFLRFFQVADVNFDGNLDIAALTEFGAKWGRQNWWVFSPSQGSFVSNQFTQAVGQVAANGLTLDAVHRRITAGHMTQLTGCGETRDIYSVEQDRLVLVHEERVSANAEGCTLTTRDRASDGTQVTKVQHFPPYHDPAIIQ